MQIFDKCICPIKICLCWGIIAGACRVTNQALSSLQDKLVRVGDGEQRWGLFQAVKPSSG